MPFYWMTHYLPFCSSVVDTLSHGEDLLYLDVTKTVVTSQPLNLLLSSIIVLD